MPATSQHGLWLAPKWLVLAVVIAAFALILSYDLKLGVAFGVLLGVIAAGWFYIALRYGSLSGSPASGRHALVARFQTQSSNRRRAVSRTAESEAESRPQRGSDPL